MYFLVIIAILVCALLGLIVLIQNPKGGGLSSSFSSSSQLLGVQKTGDILEKGTWFLAIALIVLALAINVVGKSGSGKVENVNQEQIDKASRPSAPVNSPSSLPFGQKAPAKK